MKAHSFLLALLLAAAAGQAAAQQSQGTLDKIKQAKTIRLGYLKEAIPFSFAETQGKPVGYSIDLCQRVVDTALSSEAAMAVTLALPENPHTVFWKTPPGTQRSDGVPTDRASIIFP